LVKHLQPALEKPKENVKTYVSSIIISLNKQGVNHKEIDKTTFADELTTTLSVKKQSSSSCTKKKQDECVSPSMEVVKTKQEKEVGDTFCI
jgi:hypothetical protein